MAKKEPTRRAQTLGAAYRGASSGIVLASPALSAAHSGARDPVEYLDAYRNDAKPFIAGTAVHIADQVLGQRILGHNSALGRNSVTAWAAEAIPIAYGAAEGVRGGAGWGTARYVEAKTGYNPTQGFSLEQPHTRLYFWAKVIGGIARKVSNMGPVQVIAEPVKRFLGSMGGAF